MARSSSENPRDVASSERLAARLAGITAEGERLLASLHEELAAERTDRRQAPTRARAAEETRVRRSTVGTGGQPTGTVAESERGAVAEERRAAAVRNRVQSEQRVAAIRERESRRNLPVLRGQQDFLFQPNAAEQIRLDGERAQRALAQSQAAQRAQARAQAEQSRLQSQRLGTQPLLPAAGGTGGGAPPPRPTATGGASDVPRGPGGGISLPGILAQSQAKGLNEEQSGLLERARALKITEDDLTRTLAYQSRVLGLASNAYTRHGYLTSEFITAAARGQVTFREFGTQIGGTIAKFAGWTAAAASVYGALAALRALGHGAIEAASGVQLVNRVVTDRGGINGNQLQGRFANLSRRFNLPTSDVVQAVYGSAKAFGGDLPQALKASESALFAVKVGELSAADSTRYLTAIVNGFRLEAGDLSTVFDAMNQAQNRFGGSIQQNIAGVSKAAGAVRLAGGDYRELIALIQTGVKVTGTSGENVGTAIARSAQRVLSPQGQDALRSVGLNPDQQYPQLIAQAFKEAQGASRERVRAIAGALVPSGGQFIRVFAPLLQNQKLYDRIYNEISPEKAKGSAARELATALKAPDEQIKRLGGDVERLGIQLGRLGGLAGPVALVRGLDLIAHSGEEVLSVFNDIASLTGPFKGLTVGALELYGVLRLLRRFNLGGSLPTGRPGGIYEGARAQVSRSPTALFRAQAFQGLEDQRKFVETERLRAAQSAGLLGIRSERQGLRVQSLVRGGAAEADVIAAQRRYEALTAQYAEAVDTEGFYRQQQALTQKQITGLQARNLKSMQAITAALEAEGIHYVNPTLARPFAGVPSPVTTAQGRGAQPIPPAGPRRTFIVGPADPVLGHVAEEQVVAANAAAKAQERLGSAYGRVQEPLRRLGRTGELLDRAFLATAALAGRGSGTAGAMATRVRGAATSLAAFARSLGPLDIALIAFLALPPIGRALEGLAAKGSEEQLRQVSQTPTSGSAAGRQYDEAGKIIDEHHSVANRLLRAEGEAFGKFLQGHFISAFHRDSLTRARQQSVEFRRQEDVRQIYARGARAAGFPNVPAPGPAGATGLYSDELVAQVEHDAEQRRQGLISQAEFDLRMTNHRVEVAHLLHANADQINAGYQALAAAYGGENSGQNRRRALLGLDDKGLSQFVAAQVAQLQDLGGGGGRTQALRDAYAEAERRYGGKADSASISALSQVRQQYFQAIKATADAELQASLAGARTEGQRKQAYAVYERALRVSVVGGDQGRRDLNKARVEAQRKALTEAQAATRDANSFRTAPGAPNAFGLSGLGAVPQGASAAGAALRQRVRREASKLRQLLRQQGIFDRSLDAAQREFRQLLSEERDSSYQDRQEGRQVDLGYRQSKIGSDVGKDAAAIDTARKQVDDARRTYGSGSREWKRAMTDLNQSIHQQTEDAKQAADNSSEVSDALSLYASQLENATARASIGATEGQKLQRAIGDANSLLAFTRSHGGDQQAILQASTQVYQAQAAWADYVRQQAQALLEARKQYALSGLDPSNQVAQSRVSLRFDRRLQRFAQTPAEQLSARAQVRQDKQAYADAQAQDKYDTIEFHLAMDKIDSDVAADKIQSLAKTVKNNRALKRQFLQEAARLRKEAQGGGTYELDLASVRIPTPYEVTRAIKEGRRGHNDYRSAVLNQYNRTTINVDVSGDGDLAKVADVLDTHLRGGTRSALRARGVLA